MKEYAKKNNRTDGLGIDNARNKSQTIKPINYNGFTYLPTFQQILPVIYILYMTVQICIIMNGVQSLGIKIVVLLFYFVGFAACSILWIITTKIDPTDSVQIFHRKAITSEQSFNASEFKFFCHICQTCVSKNAFHCKKCHRCVEIFDHHCKWLNNCIGAKNYFEFFYLVCTAVFLIAYHMIANVVDLVWIIKNLQQDFPWLFYLEVVTLTADLIIFCFASCLLVMHIYLITHKKTTIELIKELRGHNKIHPSTKKNSETKHEQEEQFSQECDSAQDWKLNEENKKYKIEQLTIRPNQNRKKTQKIMMAKEYTISKQPNQEGDLQLKQSGQTKLAPLKLVKYNAK